jgi:hypothetical protein
MVQLLELPLELVEAPVVVCGSAVLVYDHALFRNGLGPTRSRFAPLMLDSSGRVEARLSTAVCLTSRVRGLRSPAEGRGQALAAVVTLRVRGGCVPRASTVPPPSRKATLFRVRSRLVQARTSIPRRACPNEEAVPSLGRPNGDEDCVPFSTSPLGAGRRGRSDRLVCGESHPPHRKDRPPRRFRSSAVGRGQMRLA